MTATRSLSAALGHLGRVAAAADLAALPDAELLARFAGPRDQAAFAALVRRYGPLVLGVCRRVLRHEQDAEDAFQAAFLVLARRAGTLGRAGPVGSWLYGVAHNVARRARLARRRREAREREAAARRPAEARPATPDDDLREVLDRELGALPDKYRTAVVLCDLLGRTVREAAAEVGCPPKTLGTRLGRGRSALARRLARRGLAALAAALSPGAALAVPPRLVEAAARAATAPAAVPPAVLLLTQGVSNVMFPNALKLAAVLALGVLTLAGLSHGRHLAPAADGSPAGARTAGAGSARRANPPDLHAHLYLLFRHLFAVGDAWRHEFVSAVADDKKDGKDAAAPSGVWAKKEGEVTVEFADKGVLKIAPHGKDSVLIVVCSYTAGKDGRVKAKVTGIEGKDGLKQKVEEKLPVGTEFGFTWKVKGGAATLGDVTGDAAEPLKSHIEGEYDPKK